MEDLCIAIKVKKNIIYAYPFDYDVAATGAKVITRKGKTVHGIQKVEKDGDSFITGIFNDTRLKWDIAGRFRSPYANDYRDLYIHERYFDPDWKSKMKMTNTEWQKQFGRKHEAKPEYPTYEDYNSYVNNEVSMKELDELNM